MTPVFEEGQLVVVLKGAMTYEFNFADGIGTNDFCMQEDMIGILIEFVKLPIDAKSIDEWRVLLPEFGVRFISPKSMIQK